MTKILLVHLISNGDLLYATVIARQIKKDFPDSHLTWAVSDKHQKTLHNNPDIDVILPVNIIDTNDAMHNGWHQFKKEALIKKQEGIYDLVFFTQIIPDNLHNYDAVIRSSILRNYPGKITVAVDPVMVLTAEEIENVGLYVEKHQLNSFKRKILFECSSFSNQSHLDIEMAISISETLAQKHSDTCFILSSNKQVQSGSKQIIDGSELSYRENAELAKYCDFLIGCSSGITWLTTSTASKKLPMLQLLSKKEIFASVEYDFKYYGLATDQILEMSDYDSSKVVDCMNSILENGFSIAKKNYGEQLKPHPKEVCNVLVKHCRNLRFHLFFRQVKLYIDRNGFDFRLFKVFFEVAFQNIIKKRRVE